MSHAEQFEQMRSDVADGGVVSNVTKTEHKVVVAQTRLAVADGAVI